MRNTAPKLVFMIWLVSVLLWWLATSKLEAADAAPSSPRDLDVELQNGAQTLLRRLAAPARHLTGLSAAEVHAHAATARHELEVLREKLQGQWFAALLSLDGPEPLAIEKRFDTFSSLAGFVQTNHALVEVWTDAGGPDVRKGRRLTAAEFIALEGVESPQPTRLILTYLDPTTHLGRSTQVEFGFDAASRVVEGSSTSPAKVQAPAELLVGGLHFGGAGLSSMVEALPQTSPLKGSAIEQLPAVENATPFLATAAEPHLHTVPEIAKQQSTDVLGDLLEWRHYLQKKELNLPMETPELLQIADALEDLARKNVWIDNADALLDVDAFQRSFTYRRYEKGQPRLVSMAAHPSRAELVGEVAKAEVTRRFEEQQRAALSPTGHGIALVHRVREVNGRAEVGPLVLSEDGTEGIDALLALLDRLPVTNRARLQFSRSFRTLIDADLDGKGSSDRFFLTVSFPPGKVIQRARINPLTGEHELLIEQDGLLLKTITETRITEIDYNQDREETATRIFANLGTYAAPNKGSLLEETRTLETWPRDLAEPDLDPLRPAMVKSRVNHVTGGSAREIYGLFPWPLATVEEQRITYRQFNRYGILVSATVFDNGRTEEDFNRHILAKLNDPVIGRQRFQLASTCSANELSQLRDLKGQGYLTTVVCRDLVKGATSIQSFDNRPFGRMVSEFINDQLNGTNLLSVNVSLEYQSDFCFGQIPARVTQRQAPGGKILLQTETRSYDPFSRRLTGASKDDTGQVVTNIWDYRWSSPVETRTADRTTLHSFNQDETQVASTTTVTATGEELSRCTARLDAPAHQWQAQQLIWFRPGVTNESQSLVLSGQGRLLSIRHADSFERRLTYGPGGDEQSSCLYGKNPTSGQFDILYEKEDDYRWNAGQRNARIQRYADGHLCDLFRRLSDAAGRILADELREAPGLSLRTEMTYDGVTARLLKAQFVQNGQVRVTRHWQSEQRQTDGSYLRPVTTVPHWGLTSTQMFRLNDPLARPLSCRLENGESLRVREWFGDTDIPKMIERRDRAGRPKERFSYHLNAGAEGAVPYDLVEREKLSIWGATGFVEKIGYVRGTDLPLFHLRFGEKVYSDLSQPFDLPAYAVDPTGKSGNQVRINGQKKDHVLAVYRGQLESRLPRAVAQRDAEPVLRLDAIRLRSGGGKQWIRRTWDRAGNLLDERLAALPPAGPNEQTDEALLGSMPSTEAWERFHYRYEPGWLLEQPDPNGPSRVLSFSQTRLGSAGTDLPVNQGTFREFLTSVDGIKPAPNKTGSFGLKSYFFRKLHAPSQRERNPWLPGCLDVWSCWISQELALDGTTSSEAEVIYDAQGRLSARKLSPSSSSTGTNGVLVYRIPERNSASETNSSPVTLPQDTNLEGPGGMIWRSGE